MSSKGRLVVVSGPTASGKSTLWKQLVTYANVDFSVSATTRQPRVGEIDGRDYTFISKEEFERRVAANDFLEWATVHTNYYGTLRSNVEQSLNAGRDIVLEVDVQGAQQLANCQLPMISIFVTAPSREILIQRLRNRGTESEQQIATRLKVIDHELTFAKDYDHQLTNDNFDRMLAEAESILGYSKEKSNG
ncbi:MAG: guanylate kinase [Planctomycetes bacterium]|nr:guanylate kinase [Planctomycetota bacterium]